LTFSSPPSDPSDPSDPSKPNPPSPWKTLSSVLGFELGLGVVAVILAAFLGIDLWARMSFDLATINVAVLSTIPLLGAMLMLTQSKWKWVRFLHEPIHTHMMPLLRNLPTGGLLMIACAAGVGEELLFRGLIQQGLSDWGGAGVGLVLASLLFGAAHALNRYYALVTFVMGLYLGLLYQASENIVLVMLVHALYDWVALRFLLATSKPSNGAKY